MSKLRLVLQRTRILEYNGEKKLIPSIMVLDRSDTYVIAYRLMCAAIEDDIQSAAGAGAVALGEIRTVEAGAKSYIDSSGNAWVTHITRSNVWFEGHFDQGEGGTVSFEQYKFAVHAYVHFLEDPERKTIEVEFPEH